LSLLRSEIVFKILKRETKSINTEKSQLLCIESNTLKNFVTNQESIKKFFAIFYGFDKKEIKLVKNIQNPNLPLQCILF